ncbi:molybdopterin cofactor-binding domain-containing protein [Conexibacter sp. DBS9H8]|uniref:molybdopterin cofactor-binding domain-containing protein n=1 Tax=Conexibacter sp. DBS9H8 TaxID=2937801 RepID=UPI00200C2C32|nr:molybdopterin cofactor-binding domain-containing protein [Conexibacter sp. DBS9H8]
MATSTDPLIERPVSRRRFIAFLVAGPTLIAAARLERPAAASAAGVPTSQPVDEYDLSDLLNDAAAPTANLIRVVIEKDGSVSFAMPRAEVGQGITTAAAMIIADELDVPLSQINITLADAEPQLVFNQLTGGSNTIHSIYDPLRAAAAAARGALLQAAALYLNQPVSQLSTAGGAVLSSLGQTVSYATLSTKAAVSKNTLVKPNLKPHSAQQLVGTPQRRIDALAAVTGTKVFAMDITPPGALPTMVCRAPTLNGSARSLNNEAEILAMPGVTDVAVIPHSAHINGGVAVRAATFGQCIDAIRAMQVDWAPGTAEGMYASDVESQLIKSELPMTPALGDTIDERFVFNFRPGDPLETNCAVAVVTKDSAEIWSSLKAPIWAQEKIASLLGMQVSQVTCHVTQGGGSFGRHLFADAAFESAVIAQKMGKPVKLMWHRADNFRQGRVHPMCTSRVRMTYSGKNIIAFDQRHTSVATDFSHGLGEILSAYAATLPDANSLGYSQSIFLLTACSPYNFGPTTQLLEEVYPYDKFNTSSVRNIYSPDVRTAGELMVDKMAALQGVDRYQFRRDYARDARMVAVLDKVAEAADWGRTMAPGTAQGIGVHREYKGYAACVVEIDCTPRTVNRVIPNGYGGPRVTKVTFVVDVGLPINPLGLQAQMMGGSMDGIAQALSYSLHLEDGYFLEASWDDTAYTRQWNTPPDVNVIVMPPTTNEPGGAGELGVAASMAATAGAYWKATGIFPTRFPINYAEPLWFTPYPTVPPIPASPTTEYASVIAQEQADKAAGRRAEREKHAHHTTRHAHHSAKRKDH